MKLDLKLKNLSKRFDGVRAVDNCTLSIEKAKITAIIGPNGSGKTTLFNMISGLLEPDDGSIEFAGRDITEAEDFERAKLGISRTFQEVRLFKHLSVREHLEIAMSDSDEKMIKSIESVFRRRLSIRESKKKDAENKPERLEQYKREQCKQILESVHLHVPLERVVTELSYGQRKLLDLAMALAKPHKILLLDEPVAGINPKLRLTIKSILKELRRKGETIIVIEHDMNFVMDLSDNVIVMDNGKIIAEGKPKQIQNNRKVLEAYLGE